MTQKLRTLGMAILAGGVVSACAGAPTRFYTLDAKSAADPVQSSYAGPPLRVDAVHIPPALDRPELVRETTQNRFTVHDNDHWAAPLGELLRRVVTQDLAARLPSGKIIFPDAPKPAGAAGIVIDILAVTPSTDVVTMDVSWTVLSQSAKPAQASRPEMQQHTARLTTPAGLGVASNAAELSRLAEQLSNRIALSLAASAPSD
jgi:uncharacterized lipoprotein YmbA